MSDAPLIEVRDLRVHFPQGGGLFRARRALKAVDGVDLAVREGETLGLVGESGCGKTTLGRAILRLVEPTGGDVLFRGRSLLALSGGALRAARRHLQVVFQDPFGSLNPRRTVGESIAEGLSIHDLVPRRERRARVSDLLERVGLRSEHGARYPHEFSGGQRQRIGIARALAVEPSFIVCDEATSALDVSVQAQILNLLKDLQEERGLAFLFISHDLAVVEHVAHRVAVMYLGRIVEEGPADEVYRRSAHPYTRALLAAIPDVAGDREGPAAERFQVEGDPPSPLDPPSGCRFRTRCPLAIERCAEEVAFTPISAAHRAACVRTDAVLDWVHGGS